MKPIDIDEIRRMVPVAGMLRAPDASPEKPSPVLDAAEVRAARSCGPKLSEYLR